jgi:cytochrome c biogenesis protein CcdA
MRRFTFFTIFVADKCGPDGNSRFTRPALVMTFTCEPPTSTAKTIFRDVGFLMGFFIVFVLLGMPLRGATDFGGSVAR